MASEPAALLTELQAQREETHRLEQQLQQEHAAREADRSRMRHAAVVMKRHAEEEEEHISNTLLRQIRKLEAEKHDLEQRGEAVHHLKEQLEQLTREKVEMENSLERESEFILNKLSREKDRLEEENRLLRERLLHPDAAGATLPVPMEGVVMSHEEEVEHLRKENTALHAKLQQALARIGALERELTARRDTAAMPPPVFPRSPGHSPQGSRHFMARLRSPSDPSMPEGSPRHHPLEACTTCGGPSDPACCATAPQ